MPTPIALVGADRSYVNQGKDPETALRLSERPNADWIRLLIESYGAIVTTRKRQISVTGDRLIVHAKVEEVAELLVPGVQAAVDRANERYADLVAGAEDRVARPLDGERGESIATAFDAIDEAIGGRG